MSVEHHWIYTTWPDLEAARSAARQLVDDRLCGCANILPGVESVYHWEDCVQADTETVVILKSPTANTGALNRRIAELHPYTTPCIIALPVISDASAPDYLTWLAKQTRPHV